MTIVKLMTIALLLAYIDAVLISPCGVDNLMTQPNRHGSHLRLLDQSSTMMIDDMTDLPEGASEHLTNTEDPPGRRISFVFRNSTVGFIRAAGAGVSVTIGASATLRYSITLEAIQASLVAEDDRAFRKKLTRDEDNGYKDLRANYTGGLNIPFMELIGANLEHNVTRHDLIRSAMSQDKYNSKAFVARELLTARTPTEVTVSGSITVRGTSILPRTFFAFIKAAHVRLNDGSTILLVSTNAVDSAAATADGLVTSSTPDSLHISEQVA